LDESPSSSNSVTVSSPVLSSDESMEVDNRPPPPSSIGAPSSSSNQGSGKKTKVLVSPLKSTSDAPSPLNIEILSSLKLPIPKCDAVLSIYENITATGEATTQAQLVTTKLRPDLKVERIGLFSKHRMTQSQTP